ncbi:MAG: zf-HC2 domain-containing protein [Gemmatimonadetes bacterium]|nr:zf-HC2 domain-containing protein [Gemmatimonadota bacterium]
MTDQREVLDCLTVVRGLWDYLDGEMSEQRLADVRAHLATCTGCREHVEFARGFVSLLGRAPLDEARVTALRLSVQRALRVERSAARD